MITVTQLLVYPFKSGRGLSVNQTGFDAEGMLNDRRLMAVDEKGVFMTGRRHPELLHISCNSAGNNWELSHPSQTEICKVSTSKDSLQGKIWRDTFDAIDGGDETANWISQILGIHCRVVLWRPSARHSGKYNLDTSFADAAPLLIASEASMRKGCDWADLPYDIRRFRPNIVINGVEAFEEEKWQSLRIGKTRFEMLDQCSRCILTTRDPDTGEAHPDKQPMKVLMEKHTDDAGQPIMGMNAKLISNFDIASITVGDTITLL